MPRVLDFTGAHYDLLIQMKSAEWSLPRTFLRYNRCLDIATEYTKSSKELTDVYRLNRQTGYPPHIYPDSLIINISSWMFERYCRIISLGSVLEESAASITSLIKSLKLQCLLKMEHRSSSSVQAIWNIFLTHQPYIAPKNPSVESKVNELLWTFGNIFIVGQQLKLLYRVEVYVKLIRICKINGVLWDPTVYAAKVQEPFLN